MSACPLSRPGGRSRRQAGFALLITVTLLAFLVLLLVSLASLTRVETQVAANQQQLVQARQNALFSLNLAIGQLQKYAGPDQRITARSDLDPALSSTTTKSGRWLGAYGSGVAASYADTTGAIATAVAAGSDAKGSQAKLLTWLVSGNEGTPFNPSTAVGAEGQITAAPDSSTIPFQPARAVDQLTLLSTALSTEITVQNADGAAKPARLLVGPATAGSGEEAVRDYVVAPLMTIGVDGSQIPGLGATGASTIGRYAWWVGDEGAKARLNLPLPAPAQAGPAFVSASRTAVELVDAINPSAKTTRLAADMLDPTGSLSRYNPGSAQLAQLLAPDQLPLLSAAEAGTLRQTAQYRFHDLTASSVSVLADTYAGGLKKDLSAVLATGAPAPADADYLFPPEAGGTNSFGVPTWGMLRSFAQTSTPAAGGLAPRLPTATQVGIAPVLTYASLGLQYAAPAGDAEGNPVRLAVFPLAVLWNPYTAPIKAAKYEFGFQRRYNGMLQLQVATDATTWTVKETLDLGRAGAPILPDGTRTGIAGSYLRFIIDAPDIPAGASLIFTLQNAESGRDYLAALDNTGEPKNTLTNGLNANGHVLLNHGAVIGPGESGKNFRIGVYGLNDADRTMFAPAPSVSSMSGGEAVTYLGEVSASGATGYVTNGTNDKKWYQAITRTGLTEDGGATNLLLQGPAPLTVVTMPTSAMSIWKPFSAYRYLRWIAQNNPRALTVTRVHGDGDSWTYRGAGGVTAKWQNFNAGPSGLEASAGTSLDSATAAVKVTLFEFRPADQPLLSLGQLQHANLSLLNGYPAYPLGNSIADFRFKGIRDQVRRAFTISPASDTSPSDQVTSYYDLSWLLNRALWDRYFVSTVPQAGTGISTDTGSSPIPTALPNPRHLRQGSPTETDLRQADKAAAGLLLAGGFNINSTSEQAWRAVLGGVNQLAYDPVNATPSSTRLKAALSRFSKPTAAPPIDTTKAWAWQGYRQLTEIQIAELAANIVAEIRNRGPFVSLADFINRRLTDNAATSLDERIKGTLQAAIDATTSGPTAVNSGKKDDYGADGTNPFSESPAYVAPGSASDVELMRGGPVQSPAPPYGSTAAYAPQFLTSADLLSALGAGLSARSDTFRIRAYGETVNPLFASTDAGYVTGQAWCEAIVQRLPDYVEPKTPSSGNAPEDAGPALTANNKAFGRQFKIISFRWLSSHDI